MSECAQDRLQVGVLWFLLFTGADRFALRADTKVD